jgi:hypothetical protein
MNDYNCPKCNKTLICENDKNEIKESGIILKSRLVFISDEGDLMCRCLNCKAIIELPMNMIKLKN